MAGFFEGRQLVIATVHTKKKSYSLRVKKQRTPSIARFAILENLNFFNSIDLLFNF